MPRQLLNKKEISIIISSINPYLNRYSENEYVPIIRQFVSEILSGKLNIPEDIDKIKEIMINAPHTLIYDNKQFLIGSLKVVLEGQTDAFMIGFYENLLKVMRGGYIDEIINDADAEIESKISFGKFFINLIDNVSVIEGINFDEYFKFKDFVQKKNMEFETARIETPDPTIEYYYWGYPYSYLKRFEALLLKYEYIEKHERFAGLFKTPANSINPNPLRFNGKKPELWYMLYKIYKGLFFKGVPLHKITTCLFEFADIDNSNNVINSGWSKFREQMEGSKVKNYIQERLADADKLIIELDLPK